MIGTGGGCTGISILDAYALLAEEQRFVTDRAARLPPCLKANIAVPSTGSKGKISNRVWTAFQKLFNARDTLPRANAHSYIGDIGRKDAATERRTCIRRSPPLVCTLFVPAFRLILRSLKTNTLHNVPYNDRTMTMVQVHCAWHIDIFTTLPKRVMSTSQSIPNRRRYLPGRDHDSSEA